MLLEQIRDVTPRYRCRYYIYIYMHIRIYMLYIIGVRGRYLMRYSFPIYLIGRESKITNFIGRESQSECLHVTRGRA